MIDQIEAPGTEPRWASAQPPQPPSPAAPDTSLNRFLGGSPVTVFFRLLVVSLVVGALLMWLDIRPMDVIIGVERFARRIWSLGFDAVREVAEYIVAGAVIVIPIWLVLRLMNVRGPR
jgi:hypothetical protein